MIVLPRRKFLTGLLGLVAAPAVIRVADLMPVKALPAMMTSDFVPVNLYEMKLYEELAAITREYVVKALCADLLAPHPLLRLFEGNARIET
jgi:hypothetical protein